MINKIFAILTTAGVLCSSLGVMPALAQSKTATYEDDAAGEDSFNSEEIKKVDASADFLTKLDSVSEKIDDYDAFLDMAGDGKIIMSEADKEAVRSKKVDDGLLGALVYLVTPVSQGGAGFERLKIKRLVKGYSTQKKSLSRETEYEKVSDINVSAHFKGQAVDISEIDLIRIKKKTKKKAFGVTYSSKSEDLPSVPIMIGWQSDKGRGVGIPGFSGDTANELFYNLSLGAIKEMLSESVDYDLGNLKGSDWSQWSQWLGAIILFEDYDLPIESFEGEANNFDEAMREMGKATIARLIGVNAEGIKGKNWEEFLVNAGQGYIEEKADLEPGSIEGNSLEEIFTNAGKRKVEKELGLSRGSLEVHVKEATEIIKGNKRWGIFKTNQAKNEALNLPAGSSEQLEAGDMNGFTLAGAGVVLTALAAEDKKDLVDKVRKKQALEATIPIDESNLAIDVEPETLKDILSKDASRRNYTLTALGKKALDEVSKHTDLSIGLSSKEWDKIKAGKIKIDDIALSVGARKYEQEFDLPENSIYYTLRTGKSDNFFANVGRASLEETGKDPSKYSDVEKKRIGQGVIKAKVAKELNRKYGLEDQYNTYSVTEQDILNLLNGQWEKVGQKIASRTLDKAMDLPINGAMDLVEGKKNAEQVLIEAGAVKLGKVLGLSRAVSIEGDLRQIYGQALVEETLGLKERSFTGTIRQVRAANGKEKFRSVFGKPDRTDAWLGLAPETTQGLVNGTLSPSDYAKKVADKSLMGVSLEKVVNLLGLSEGSKPTPEELSLVLSVIQGWDTTSWENKTAALSVLGKMVGNDWESKLGFDPGSVMKIIGNPQESAETLLTQGMKKLNREVFGIDKDVVVLHYRDGQGLDLKLDGITLGEWATPKIMATTGIDNSEDAFSFLNGNIQDGFNFWGIATLAKEANDSFDKAGIPNAKISYADARKAFVGDSNLEQQMLQDALGSDYKNATPAQKELLIKEIRKEVKNNARKELQYRTYDALLLDKLDGSIPVGFSKVMFEGTPEERSAVMGSYVINKVTGGYVSLDNSQMAAFNNYFSNQNPDNFNKLVESGALNSVDSYLSSSQLLGFKVEPGTTAALVKAAKGGAGLEEGFRDLTKSYKDWAEGKVFAFADQALGFPAGATYNVYQNYNTYKDAYNTYKAINSGAAAGDLAQAKKALDTAKINATSFIVSLVGGETFSRIDEQLGLPAGSTEGLVTLLITGNPTALIIAVVKSFFTTKVYFYGEKPVCERAGGQLGEIKPGGDIRKLADVAGSGWERLSGDPEKDFQFYQRHARCSVKRVLGSLLNIEEVTQDKRTKPVQVLTLRPEDVEYYADKIREVYGKTEKIRGKRGVMSSNIFWDYVHIGY